MSEIWPILFSPWGVAAYAAFWALKLTVGAWALRKLMPYLPRRLRRGIERLTAQPRLAVARIRRARRMNTGLQ